MIRRGAVRASGGYTMLEVLIASAMLLMLVVTVYATFNRSRHVFAKVHKMQQRWHVVRIGMQRMTQDLSMAYLSLGEDLNAIKRRTYFRYTSGDHGKELRFSAFAHRRLYKDANESDQCIIQYFVAGDPEERGKLSLFRRETRRLQNEEPEKIPGEAYVLINNVREIRYQFFDKKNDKWQEEWDSTSADGPANRIPNRIRIYLEIDNENGKAITLVTQVAPTLVDALNLVPGSAATPPGRRSSRGKRKTRGVRSTRGGLPSSTGKGLRR